MEKKSDVVIGQSLRRLRGIRVAKKLAEEIGIPVSTYRAYEYGQRHVSDENKIKIANYYGMPVSAIFFDNDEHIECSK